MVVICGGEDWTEKGERKKEVVFRSGPASGLVSKAYLADPALDAGILGGRTKRVYIWIPEPEYIKSALFKNRPFFMFPKE